MRDPNDPAQPLDQSVEVGVAQESPNEGSHFILPNTRDDQAIAWMAEVRVIEVSVAREKCDIAPPTQQNENFFVLQTFAPKVETDLPRRHPPRLEQQALSVKDVLVEDNQA